MENNIEESYTIKGGYLSEISKLHKKYQERAENRLVLNHYTTADCFEKILQTKSIKASRIDNVNDTQETYRIIHKKAYKRVFIACFNHNVFESIPQWYMYTHKNEQGKEDGIYLSLRLKEHMNPNLNGLIDISKPIKVYYNNNTWDNYKVTYGDTICKAVNQTNHKNKKCSMNISVTDVIYSDFDIKHENMPPKSAEDRLLIVNNLARVKSRYWDFEHETRIIITFVSEIDALFTPPKDIYIPMNYNNMDIRVILNPWSSDDFKLQINNLCVDNIPTKHFKIIESDLTSTLKDRI